MKNHVKRLALLIMSAAIAVFFSSASTQGLNNAAAPQGESAALQSVTAVKDETVFALLKNDGSVDGIYVSNRIETPSDGIYTDLGDYSEVVPMAVGVVPVFGRNSVSFELTENPSGFTYNGKLKEGQLPVVVAITYKLNSQITDADKLIGASGDIEINVKITQNESCREELRSRFAAQLRLTLDLTRCTNINISGAASAIAGNTQTITATMLPGASLDAAVSFKANDFRMDGISVIMSAFSSSVIDLSAFGLDAASLAGLGDKTAALESGARNYLDGVSQLNTAAAQLSAGAGLVTSSTDDLTSGYATLKNGVLDIISVLEKLLPTLPQGQRTALSQTIGELRAGLDDFDSGLDSYCAAVLSSAGYINKLSDGLDELASQNDTLYSGITELTQGLGAFAQLLSVKDDASPFYSFAAPEAQVKSLSFVLQTKELNPEVKVYTPAASEDDKGFLGRLADLFR